jgi:hypothetical protein
MMQQEMLLGNFAIARGLLEAGCSFFAAYPGTPSSEILPGLAYFKEREKKKGIYFEWSANEKVAFEVAFGAAFTGKRAAIAMKQVGLNALIFLIPDPSLSAAALSSRLMIQDLSLLKPNRIRGNWEYSINCLFLIRPIPGRRGRWPDIVSTSPRSFIFPSS